MKIESLNFQFIKFILNLTDFLTKNKRRARDACKFFKSPLNFNEHLINSIFFILYIFCYLFNILNGKFIC